MAQPDRTFVKGIYVDTRTGKPYLPKRIADVLDPMKQRVKGIKEVKPLKRTDSQRAELLRLEKEIHKIELRIAQSMAATSVSRAAYYRSKNPDGPAGEMNIPSEEAYQSSLRKAGLKSTQEYRTSGRSRSKEDLPTLLRLVQNGLLSLSDIENAKVRSIVTRVLDIEPPNSSKSYGSGDMETKVGKYWRDGLRIEPYNPDAVDADGDGVIQEGTAWERPALTTMIDELGKAIIRGATSTTRNLTHQVVDANGKRVKYDKPLNPATTAGRKAPSKPKKWSSPLGRSGWPSLRERGHRTLLEVFSAMHERTIATSTRPDMALRDWERLPTARVVSVTLPGGQRATVPVEGLRQRIIRLEFIENARLLASDIYDSLRGRRINVHSDKSLETHRQKVDRVTERFGTIATLEDARRALAEAYPNVVTRQLECAPEDDEFLATRLLGPTENLPPHVRGGIIGLLDQAMKRPEIAQKVVALNFEHLSGSGIGGSAGCIPVLKMTNGIVDIGAANQLKFGYSITLDTSRTFQSAGSESLLDYYKTMAEKFQTLLDGEMSNPQGLSAELLAIFRAGNRLGVEYNESTLTVIDMILDPNISDAETSEYLYASTAAHEYGHVANYDARLLDNGVNLLEDQDTTWFVESIERWAQEETGSTTAGLAVARLINRVYQQTVDDAQQAWAAGGGVQGGNWLHIFTGLSQSEKTASNGGGYGYGVLDNLTLSQKLIVERIARSHISEYADYNEKETIAELYVAFDNNPDSVMQFVETDEEKEAIMQLMDWLNGNRDERHVLTVNPRSQDPETLVTRYIENATRFTYRRRAVDEYEVIEARKNIFRGYINQLLTIVDEHDAQRTVTERVLENMRKDVARLELDMEAQQANIQEGASINWTGSDGVRLDEANIKWYFERAVAIDEDLRTTRRLLQQSSLLEQYSDLPLIDYLRQLVDIEETAEREYYRFKSFDSTDTNMLKKSLDTDKENVSDIDIDRIVKETIAFAHSGITCAYPTVPKWTWKFR